MSHDALMKGKLLPKSLDMLALLIAYSLIYSYLCNDHHEQHQDDGNKEEIPIVTSSNFEHIVPEEYHNMEFNEFGIKTEKEEEGEGGIGMFGGLDGIKTVIDELKQGVGSLGLENRINSIYYSLKGRMSAKTGQLTSGNVLKSYLKICNSLDFFGASMYKVRRHKDDFASWFAISYLGLHLVSTKNHKVTFFFKFSNLNKWRFDPPQRLTLWLGPSNHQLQLFLYTRQAPLVILSIENYIRALRANPKVWDFKNDQNAHDTDDEGLDDQNDKEGSGTGKEAKHKHKPLFSRNSKDTPKKDRNVSTEDESDVIISMETGSRSG